MTELRITAVRSLRLGGRIVGWSDSDAASARDVVTVTGLQDLERSGQIKVTVDFDDGSKGEMKLYPNKKLRRVVQPDEEPGGTVMVSGDDLWKFVGENFSDPQGSGDKFVITGFKRPNPRDGSVWIGLKSHTSDRMFNAQYRSDAHISCLRTRSARNTRHTGDLTGPDHRKAGPRDEHRRSVEHCPR